MGLETILLVEDTTLYVGGGIYSPTNIYHMDSVKETASTLIRRRKFNKSGQGM